MVYFGNETQESNWERNWEKQFQKEIGKERETTVYASTRIENRTLSSYKKQRLHSAGDCAYSETEEAMVPLTGIRARNYGQAL